MDCKTWQQARDRAAGTHEKGENMGRHKKFSRKRLEQKWEEYKEYCNNIECNVIEFSQKASAFVEGTTKRCISLTIEGFCVWLGLSRAAFYAYYREDPEYVDIVTRMREECEIDCRQKFETERIPTRLAGIWMSRYEGYQTKAEVSTPDDKKIEVVIKSDTGETEEGLAD